MIEIYLFEIFAKMHKKIPSAFFYYDFSTLFSNHIRTCNTFKKSSIDLPDFMNLDEDMQGNADVRNESGQTQETIENEKQQGQSDDNETEKNQVDSNDSDTQGDNENKNDENNDNRTNDGDSNTDKLGEKKDSSQNNEGTPSVAACPSLKYTEKQIIVVVIIYRHIL